MGTVLQWRRFNFFDVKGGVDKGKIREVIQDAKICSVGSGRGIIYFGDSNGWLHCLNRSLQVSSFLAHDTQIEIIRAFDHTSRIVTSAVSAEGSPEIKIWAPDRLKADGQPLCLRVITPDPRPPQMISRGHPVPLLTSLAIHSNMSLMALGFSDGSIMLFRGEIGRERGSKSKVVLTVSNGGITNLHLRETTKSIHLYATTKNKVYCINCSSRDKETTVELDTIGCDKGCATLADGKHHHNLLMARSDAIFTYTTDSRASCYVFEGEKVHLSWFKDHLIVVAKDKSQDAVRDDALTLTVFDPVNKLVALNTYIKGLVDVVGEWGGLYAVTPDSSVIHVSEKDLQSKLEILFRKNQFDIAISLAKMQRCDSEEIAEILRQYGDWLYGKGNLGTAMDQYIKTIPYVEPSYVIKKYLDTQHINHLTTYLQVLHKAGAAKSDHTSLMLNCYTRLRDTQQLDEFITSQGGTIDCDVELGVRVCRGAGYYDHALALAAKHNLHHHHIAILIDDKKDYHAALNYISTLDFDSAKENVLRYGSILLTNVPEETTKLIISLCTDYKSSNELLLSEGSLDSYLKPYDVQCGDPEDFEYLLVGHSESAIMLLEHLINNSDKSISSRLYNTLLGEYLHQYSLDPEGQDQSAYGEKALRLLRNGEGTYDKDNALLLCDKYKFHAGKLVLWEHANMYDQLMEYHSESGNFDNVVKVCTKYGENEPKLWVKALKLITSDKSLRPPDAEHLNKILEEIERHSAAQKKQTNSNSEELLSPLEVVDLLASSPHITLGQVRSFLLRVVSQHNAATNTEESLTQQYSTETARMREQITAITTAATEFTGTKCNICNNELELPSIHFLCRHSFHQHCFESYSEDSSCHICLPEVRKIKQEMNEMHKNNERSDTLQEKLESSGDIFSVVADYLGSGIFTQCNKLASMYPNLNTTKDTLDSNIPLPVNDSKIPKSNAVSEARIRESEMRNKHKKEDYVPPSEGRMRALEKNHNTSGHTAEARIRMNERKSQGVLEVESESRIRMQDRQKSANSAMINSTSEARIRANFHSNIIPNQSEGVIRATSNPSNIVMPISEARIRVKNIHDGNGSSIHDHITPTPSAGTTPDTRERYSPSQSISASVSGHNKSNKEKPAVDNPFDEPSDGLNPFGDDFETEEMNANPFQDEYDDSKNPFGEDTETPEESNNPFSDTENSEELDPTNPFS